MRPPYRRILTSIIVLLLAALTFSRVSAQSFYKADSAEKVISKLVTPITSSQTTPFNIVVLSGDGAKFRRIGLPQLITISPWTESDVTVIEEDSVSGASGDTLIISKRALSNTTQSAWPAGSRVSIRISGVMLTQLQSRITNIFPDSTGKDGYVLSPKAGGGYQWIVNGSGGVSGVASFMGRTGSVTSSTGDYSFSQIGGTLPVTQGGTGLSSIATNQLLYGSATNTIAPLTLGTGLSISSGVLNTDLSGFTTANLAEGTNLYYTDTRARNALSATTPLTYSSSSGVFGIGQATTVTNGYVSYTDWNKFNGKATFPDSTGNTNNYLKVLPGGGFGWAAATGTGGGTVTSVGLSGGATGLTASGSPITGAGTITLGGTLAVANGGTGANTATGALVNLLPDTTGKTSDVLTVKPGGGISWLAGGGGGGAVSSVFGRTGAVVATSGDYTAAQVTHAADLTAANIFLDAPQTVWEHLNGASVNFGLALVDQSTATSGSVVETPPSLEFRGHAWNTTTAADNPFNGQVAFLPGSGGTPTGKFSWQTNNNGAGYVEDMSLTSDGALTASSFVGAGGALTSLNASNISSGTLPFARGGTGQGTQQAAMDALAGTQSSGKYLRSDGTHTTLSTISTGDVPTLNQNTTGTAANVTGTVAIANGGTGQTAANAAFNALSPLTTLGDLTYEDATPKAVRLAGNTTSTKKFLTQTGTGTVSAVPAWGTIASGDVPADAGLPSETGNSGKYLTTNGTSSSWATVSGGGLTNFTESVNTATPNGTIPVVQLLATNAATNVDMALTPKGTGALTARVADNSTNGNKRGAGAVDWQLNGGVAQIASGTSSTICGGNGNRASGNYSTVLGGDANVAAGINATVTGHSNTASADYSSVIGGSANTASGVFSVLIGGDNNSTSAGAGGVFCGELDNSSAGFSVALGGQHALVGGTSSGTLGGAFLSATGYAQVVIGQYNTLLPASNNTTAYNAADPLFIIGNGTGTGSRSNAFTVTGSGTVSEYANNIQTTYTDGMVISNSTVSDATHTVQQSPNLTFQSHVWNTTATAADNTFYGRQTFVPASGATPTAKFSWAMNNNGAGYSEKMSLTDAGALTVAAATATGLLTSSGGLRLAYLAAPTSTTLTSGIEIVGANSSGGAETITMPPISTLASGQVFIIKDVGADAATNNITIVHNGADAATIDGATSYVMSTNRAVIRIFYDGANYQLF